MPRGSKGQKIKRLSAADKELAWDLYFTQRQSSEAIAKQIGVSGPAIRMFLKKNGGVIRDAVEAHRTKPLNEHIFDTLTTETLYWLGALMTDGCVYDEDNQSSSTRVALEWEEKDKEHLQRFDVFMGGAGDTRLTKHPKKLESGGWGIYWRWDARSEHLAQTLINYGIVPRKTKVANPAECLRGNAHFWRGVIDGNGHIREDKGTPKIHLGGSFPIVDAFCDYCCSVCPEYAFQQRPTDHTDCTVDVSAHAHGAMAMFKALYKNEAIAMPRKKQRALYLLEKHADRDFRILGTGIHQRRTFPYAYTMMDDATEDFEKLKAVDARELMVSQLKGGVSAAEAPKISKTRVGAIASGFFHEEARMKARTRGKESPESQWAVESIREKIIWEYESGKHSSLHGSMAANCQLCWGFPPTTAKAIYQHFCNDIANVRILDPCAGWGDRMTAALSLKNFGMYLGFDPNTNMKKPYERIVNCYGGYEKAEVLTRPFEEATLAELLPEFFDIAFTSPPYFDYEKYSEDPDQSYKKYPNIQMWRENFLASIPRLCASALKSKGVLAINISDAGKAPLIKWLLEEADKVKSLRFIGMLSMETGNFTRTNEGIFCWRKD